MTLYVFQKGRDIKYILKTIKLNALLVERFVLLAANVNIGIG